MPLWLPNCWAKVATSLKTPPNLPPTSCPYSKHLLSASIISLIANNAESTSTVASLLWETSPFLFFNCCWRKNIFKSSFGSGSFSASKTFAAFVQTTYQILKRCLQLCFFKTFFSVFLLKLAKDLLINEYLNRLYTIPF